MRFAFARVVQAVRTSPFVLLVAPLTLFMVLTGAGVWAVMWSSKMEEEDVMRQARSTANSTALALELLLFVNMQPAVALALFVLQDPQWAAVTRGFAGMAGGMLENAEKVGYPKLLPTTMRLTPFGVISDSMPSVDPWSPFEDGTDNFLDPVRRFSIVQTAKLNATTLAWMDTPPALYVRVPVFVHNASQHELWGRPNDTSMREFCAPCFRPDLRQKFWGVTSVLLDPTKIIDGTFFQLADLARQHYVYKLFRPGSVGSTTPDILISGTASDDVGDMLEQAVIVPNSNWFLFLMPVSGWKPVWGRGLIAATIILSAIASVLVFLLLLSVQQHNLLLHSLVPGSVVKRVQQGLESPQRTYDAFVSSRTPAETIHDIMSQLLRGVIPSVQDVMLVRTAMLHSFDLYAPMGLKEHLLDASTDLSVGASLVALVGADTVRVHGQRHGNGNIRGNASNHPRYVQTGDNLRSMLEGIVGPVVSPSASLMEDMEYQLSTAHSWRFDVFELDAKTNGRPLSALAFYLLSCSGLITSFHLPTTQLVRCLKAIEDGYSDDNPYHNRKHAADVLQSMHLILHQGGLLPGYADELTLLACYLAAAMHDFQHGGHTNDYLIRIEDTLALTYNDKSPLENHHMASAYTMMQDPSMNFLGSLDREDGVTVRRLLIDLILATDMKQHFSIASQFGYMHRATRGSADGSCTRTPSQTLPRTSSESTVALGLGSPASNKVPLDDTERLVSLQMALKLSDLGHLSAPLHLHLRWVHALQEEFFRQGDSEKACSILVSPLFDRDKPGVTKSQVGFLEVVVLPCLKQFVDVFEGCEPLLSAARLNHSHWSAHV